MDYINLNINICDYITIENLHNYLIDKDITINENDTRINKLKFFLLKYKRIIAIIFFIILLIIGHYCDYNYLEIKYSNSYLDRESEKDQYSNNSSKLKGGANEIAPDPTPTPTPAAAPDAGAPLPKKPKTWKQKLLKGSKPKFIKQAQGSKAAQTISKGVSKIGETLKSGKMDALKSGAAGIGKFGSNRVQDFKEFSPWLYSIIYSVALTIMGFIIILPALALFVIGTVCFVILKDKIGFMKSL